MYIAITQCADTYTCTHAHTHVHVQTCTRTDMHTHARVHTHTHTHAHAHARMHTHTHTCTHRPLQFKVDLPFLPPEGCNLLHADVHLSTEVGGGQQLIDQHCQHLHLLTGPQALQRVGGQSEDNRWADVRGGVSLKAWISCLCQSTPQRCLLLLLPSFSPEEITLPLH